MFITTTKIGTLSLVLPKNCVVPGTCKTLKSMDEVKEESTDWEEMPHQKQTHNEGVQVTGNPPILTAGTSCFPIWT